MDELTSSAVLFNLIKKWEQFRSKAYPDKKGVWTTGFGHTRTVTKDTPDINIGQAIALLKTDVKIVETYINYHFHNLRQCQFDALVSLLFNIGADDEFLKTKTAKFIKRNPDSRFVAYNWIEFTLSGNEPSRGLLRRRIDELSLYYNW